MTSSLNASGGVLIIGSLFWQDNLGTGNNTVRRDWRASHLDMNARIPVNAPIRYGRMSGGGIYTMTFANSVRTKPGTAWLVPFQQNPITGFPQLLSQTRELSQAEGMDGRFIKSSNNVPWSVVGILFNESKIAPPARQLLAGCWSSELQADSDYLLFDHSNFRLGTEKPCILQNGVLNFPWISAADDKDKVLVGNYDFLIATATLPTDRKYPSVTKMVENVKADKDRQYFRNNYRSGITTFQDQRIVGKLGKK